MMHEKRLEFTKARRASPHSPGRTDNHEAVFQYNQGMSDAVIEGLQKAVKADPKSAEAQYNVGLSFDKMGKHTEVTAAFKQAWRSLRRIRPLKIRQSSRNTRHEISIVSVDGARSVDVICR